MPGFQAKCPAMRGMYRAWNLEKLFCNTFESTAYLVSKLKNNKAAEANRLLGEDFNYSFGEPVQRWFGEPVYTQYSKRVKNTVSNALKERF